MIGHRAKIRRSRGNLNQAELFASSEQRRESANECHIVAVGKRRDGGTRYWCTSHKADGTAKYGRPAEHCRAWNIPPITAEDTLVVDVEAYEGGIAVWGAVPPIYDTTRMSLDRGVHVHARKEANGKKVLDCTARAVRLVGGSFPKEGFLISDVNAVYYMVATVFGHQMKSIECPYCGCSHLDKDWFSVHPHKRHLCGGCGRHFVDSSIAIGNPICSIRQYGAGRISSTPARRTLEIRQADYPGGVRVWGSNSSIFWTGHNYEEEGIHVHAYDGIGLEPVEDDTFFAVTIDGIELGPEMVRTLMAQMSLPHLQNRIVAMTCGKCRAQHRSMGDGSFTPAVKHRCLRCGNEVRARGRLRKVVANPLVDALDRLADSAPRTAQKHSLGLLPETP